jgi:hypothetical protein
VSLRLNNRSTKYFIVVLLCLILSSCFTLADDITPQPGIPQFTSAPATQVPRPTSTPSELDSAVPTIPPVVGEGIVSVEIIDQTGGSLLSKGLEIVLEGYDQFELAYQEVLPVDATGQVLFTDVPLDPDQVFFASISYGGAVYRSELVAIDESIDSLDLFIQLFDTTTDDDGLFIERVHVLVEFVQPDLVNVVEIYIFSNLGDKTVVALDSNEPSVVFPLPADAGSIGFDDGVLGRRYLLTEDGFGDTVSIPPGTGVYQVLVYYTLPYQRNKLEFIQDMAYPVGAVVVMAPADNIKVKSSELVSMGIQDLPSGPIQVFSGGAISKEQPLEFRISGKPAGLDDGVSTTPGTSRTLLYVLAGAGGLLFLSGIVLYLRNRHEGEPEFTEEDLGISQEEILDSIIALEDLHEQGEVSEKAYNKKRKELKDQLKDLTEQ